MTTVDVRVANARWEQVDLRARAEHCSIDQRLLDRLGLCPGRQIRLIHPTAGPALFTVSEERYETDPGIVRLGPGGRGRLGADSLPFAAVLSVAATDPDPGRDPEPAAGLVEHLGDDGATGLAVLAPHGGGIEPGTDTQAEVVGSVLGRSRASVWHCRGFWPPELAFERWHITSTDLEPRSFPGLLRLRDRGFAHAVAFHGATLPRTSAVLVGGLAPPGLREAVVDEVATALAGTGFGVRLATGADGLNGDNPRNLVNRLTVEGRTGIQIEQSLAARKGHGDGIARAVAAVYDRLLPRSR